MEDCCSKCKSTAYKTEKIKIGYSGEIVTFIKCNDCGTIKDVEIERPSWMALRKKHGAREIRFTENERRNFAAEALAFLDAQTKLLAAIAKVTGVDSSEIKKILEESEDDIYYECLIGKDDFSYPPGS